LLQFFAKFKGRTRKLNKPKKGGTAIRVDTPVDEKFTFRLSSPGARETGPGEIKRVIFLIEYDLHGIWISVQLGIVGRECKSSHVGSTILDEHRYKGVEFVRLSFRLVSLKINDDFGIERTDGLGDSFGSAMVLRRSHERFSAEGLHGIKYSAIISSHDYVIERARCASLFPNVLNKRLPGSIQQWFPRKAG
jgi:hypothetical protein